MTEGSLKVAITTDKFSSQTIQSINLLKENQKLKTELADFKVLSEIIKKFQRTRFLLFFSQKGKILTIL